MEKLNRSKPHGLLIHLSEEEINRPGEVLKDFFSCFQPNDARKKVWDWLAAALSSEDTRVASGFERGQLIFFARSVEKLIEATFLILEQGEVQPLNRTVERKSGIKTKKNLAVRRANAA